MKKKNNPVKASILETKRPRLFKKKIKKMKKTNNPVKASILETKRPKRRSQKKKTKNIKKNTQPGEGKRPRLFKKK